MGEHSQLEHVQGMMIFLASAASGLEELLGRGAGSVTFRAGRQTGLAHQVTAARETDLLVALDRVWDEMCAIGMRWAFEPYKPSARSQLITEENGEIKLQLVFRNCMVRSSLFRYGHPQKLSLCLMNHGLFCGLVEKVYGGRASLDVVHAGENACLKTLTVRR